MKYILDTDTLIDFLQDGGRTRTRITEMLEQGDEFALCSITVSELFTGLNQRRREEWRDLFASLPYWDISREAAMQAGIDRRTASEVGRTLATTDALIAGLARENNAVILTSNIKDYPMKDVRVMSLRDKAA
jgi:predicted nucleic acid-binding protein